MASTSCLVKPLKAMQSSSEITTSLCFSAAMPREGEFIVPRRRVRSPKSRDGAGPIWAGPVRLSIQLLIRGRRTLGRSFAAPLFGCLLRVLIPLRLEARRVGQLFLGHIHGELHDAIRPA